VDAAQSIGHIPIDVKKMNIDCLCFSGHKALMGPPGTGGFFIHKKLVNKITPLKFGGTGIKSRIPIFIKELPYKFEVGTQNLWGIAGLNAGLDYITKVGIKKIDFHIKKLTAKLIKNLKNIPDIIMYLPKPSLHHGIVSFNFKNIPALDTAALLDNLFNIKVRAGLHCAPLTHKLLKTEKHGTVRISFSFFNTYKEVNYLIEYLKKLGEELCGKKIVE